VTRSSDRTTEPRSREPAVAATERPVFALPVGGNALVYAPLHGLVELVAEDAAPVLRAALQGRDLPTDASLHAIARRLLEPGRPAPTVRCGSLREPLFLGIIPTRGCNMACGYCDFAAPKQASPVMDLELARAALDAYLTLLAEEEHQQGYVHFFGGEPFHAMRVVEFVVAYGMRRAADLGIGLRFEASTNGLLSGARAGWVADHFGSILLSLDGPREVHDRQRPLLGGAASFDLVCRTARILSEGAVELIVRTCVTAANVERLREWAGWIGDQLRPSTVCFEGLRSSPASAAAGLLPPDPYRFAEEFAGAARILDDFGIEAVQSTTDLSECRISACPVGRDALIVSPDGAVDACYLLESEWRAHGLDLRLGRVDVAAGRLDIPNEALDRVRRLAGRAKPLCANCFCRYHCAGGCHVHHDTSSPRAAYDDMCVVTRLISAERLLRRIQRRDLGAELLSDRAAGMALARQPDDRLRAGAAEVNRG
jgi:uncharacterized protein